MNIRNTLLVSSVVLSGAVGVASSLYIRKNANSQYNALTEKLFEVKNQTEKNQTLDEMYEVAKQKKVGSNLLGLSLLALGTAGYAYLVIPRKPKDN